MQTHGRDRFDDLVAQPGRVGAHRAENPRVTGAAVFLWALVAAVVLVVAGVLAVLVGQGRLSIGPGPGSVAPSASASASAAPEGTVDTSYSILILNGTAQEDLVADVQSRLFAQNWTEDRVTTSNSSETDFPETIVYYVTPQARSAALGVAEIVGAAEVVENADYPFAGVPEDQLTVVLGLDQLESTDSGEGSAGDE